SSSQDDRLQVEFIPAAARNPQKGRKDRESWTAALDDERPDPGGLREKQARAARALVSRAVPVILVGVHLFQIVDEVAHL
ncbi:hypothetical protein, partial [Burkholderia sp. SIMBA_019]|uniref:hypothetical protein n=1 Tax=Burkholderia sp. SIMBA_019 TaxID=3085765 RepID=UPI003979E1B8